MWFEIHRFVQEGVPGLLVQHHSLFYKRKNGRELYVGRKPFTSGSLHQISDVMVRNGMIHEKIGKKNREYLCSSSL